MAREIFHNYFGIKLMITFLLITVLMLTAQATDMSGSFSRNLQVRANPQPTPNYTSSWHLRLNLTSSLQVSQNKVIIYLDTYFGY